MPSKRKRQRRSVRMARYVNRYAHIPYVFIGGRAAGRAILHGTAAYGRVRAHQKHSHLHGYKRDTQA